MASRWASSRARRPYGITATAIDAVRRRWSIFRKAIVRFMLANAVTRAEPGPRLDPARGLGRLWTATRRPPMAVPIWENG
jgi:hypothetical protein